MRNQSNLPKDRQTRARGHGYQASAAAAASGQDVDTTSSDHSWGEVSVAGCLAHAIMINKSAKSLWVSANYLIQNSIVNVEAELAVGIFLTGNLGLIRVLTTMPHSYSAVWRLAPVSRLQICNILLQVLTRVRYILESTLLVHQTTAKQDQI